MDYVPDQKMVREFEKEVSAKSVEVDEGESLDWFSLCIGWAIAKGMTPAQAWKFSTYIRYHTELA